MQDDLRHAWASVAAASFATDPYTEVPGRKVEVADTVGAGDAFAAALLHGIDQGWDAHRCGTFANAVGALVASRPGAIPEWKVDEVWQMTGEVPAKDCY